MRKTLIVLTLTLFAAILRAQTVRTFVSTSGSDANACTRAAPCRNFGAAVAAVNAAGEVVVLDSGGYGPVTITKSVSIIAPTAVHAAIAPTTGSAITIVGGASDITLLRNLYLHSQGAATGIDFSGGGALIVEGGVITRFGGNGVTFAGQDRLVMTDTVVRNNGSTCCSGIYIGSARALLERVSVTENAYGIVVDAGEATVKDSVISKNANFGAWARGFFDGFQHFTGYLHLFNTTIEGSETGVVAGFPQGGPESVGTMSVTGCLVHNNSVGIQSEPGNLIRVSSTTVTRNSTGLGSGGGGLWTYLNNYVAGNNTDGAFNNTEPVN